MSEKQKFAKSEKKLTLLSKTVENSEIRVKEFAKKIMLHRRAAPRNSNMQKTKLQISSTHASQHNGWWGYKLFNVFIFNYRISFNSFRRNYSFFNLAIVENSNSCCKLQSFT